MDSKDFTKEYYEAKIFNELKDTSFAGINDIKKKYPNLDIDYYNVYRKILNYRIKKYGTSFISAPDNQIISRVEACKRSNAAQHRRRYRLRGK